MSLFIGCHLKTNLYTESLFSFDMTEKIDEQTLKKVSTLARLNLTDEETEKFTKQLQDVLDAFKSLSEVNTEKVDPAFHPFEIKNVFREDNVEPSLTNEKALANTKHKEGKHFKGPRIV